MAILNIITSSSFSFSLPSLEYEGSYISKHDPHTATCSANANYCPPVLQRGPKLPRYLSPPPSQYTDALGTRLCMLFLHALSDAFPTPVSRSWAPRARHNSFASDPRSLETPQTHNPVPLPLPQHGILFLHSKPRTAFSHPRARAPQDA